MLEYDDPRSGSFEPLKDVPDDKFVVLGLVTTKSERMERAEELRHRIAQASRYIPMERLGLSPQCGFSSSIVGNNVSSDAERRKLELVVETSLAVWEKKGSIAEVLK